MPLRFTGRAGEYFRIWIVNVFLSVVTFGIYSAWAKVRRKRYFYGNTLLQDAAFDYLADPQKILIGRLIVVWFVLAGAQHAGMPQFIVLVVVLVLLPELVIRAARFKLDPEITAVLAHEIGHLRQRHSLRMVLHGSAATLLIIAVTGDVGSALSLGAAFPAMLLQSS